MVKNPCANIVVYKGTLVDFIEKHKRLIENYKPLKKYVNEWGYVQYVTVDMARKIIEGKLKTIESWKEKNVNKDFVVEYEEQIKSIVEYFPVWKEYKGVINV